MKAEVESSKVRERSFKRITCSAMKAKVESDEKTTHLLGQRGAVGVRGNDSDQNSPSFKSRNQKAKEYDNRDSKNVKKNKQDFDSYDSIVDLKKGYETQVIDSHEPVSHSSKDIGSFMMFANDKESVKKSVDAPISNPQQVDKFQNPVDVFVDRTVAECEPEMEVCYKENCYHVVKDICFDKGAYAKHKFMFDESVDGAAYNFFPLENFEYNRNPKDNTGMKVLNQPETDDSDEASSNHDQHNNVIHKDDSEIEELVDNFTKAMDSREDTQDSIPTGGKDEQLSVEHNSHSQLKDSSNMIEEEVLASPALGLTVDESESDYQFGPSAPAVCVKKELHQFGGCNCDKTQLPLTTIEDSSGDFSEIQPVETSQIRSDLGKSSFSAAGAVSGRISYSGSIPYSRSISIRSDSSTTSTRSFAFPM
ncbi:unnamed protein product [Lathyrus sativus]|nr:unnamed protein product [Lathyrus sativus]